MSSMTRIQHDCKHRNWRPQFSKIGVAAVTHQS